MNKNNLGCSKMFKNFNNKQKEVKADCDFICGVPNAWGEERFCLSCYLKLKLGWAKEDLNLWKNKGSGCLRDEQIKKDLNKIFILNIHERIEED